MSEPKTAEVKVVPCEPTEAMLDAAQRAWTPGVSHYEAHAIRYRAMLAASPPAETGEGERPCTCHPDEAPMPCAKRYALTDCLSAQPVFPSEGPHGYLVKDFADGWFWTPDASLACADGAAVWSLERARYETEAHPASDQSDTERMRALAKAQRVQVDCSAANLIKSGADADMVRICLGHFNDLADQIAALAEKAADK